MTKTENTCLSRIRENMSRDQIRANTTLQQPGCNSWLNINPIQEFNYNLNKKHFLDAERLRYQLAVQSLIIKANNLMHSMQEDSVCDPSS